MAQIPTLEVIFSWVPGENQPKLDQAIDYRSLVQIADHVLEWEGLVADGLRLSKVDRHDIRGENKDDPRQQR